MLDSCAPPTRLADLNAGRWACLNGAQAVEHDGDGMRQSAWGSADRANFLDVVCEALDGAVTSTYPAPQIAHAHLNKLLQHKTLECAAKDGN